MTSERTYTVQGKPIKTKEEAIFLLCHNANMNCMNIENLWCYEDICKQFGITPDDYYNDPSELSEEHLIFAGDRNYKPRLTQKKDVIV